MALRIYSRISITHMVINPKLVYVMQNFDGLPMKVIFPLFFGSIWLYLCPPSQN